MLDMPTVEIVIMHYDASNPEHLYQWCSIAHGFYRNVYLLREVESGVPLAEVWNKEIGEWDTVESVTPEYVLSSAEETRKSIEQAYLTNNFIGLKHLQRDFIEEFGHEFTEEEINEVNKLINNRLGADAPKIKQLK